MLTPNTSTPLYEQLETILRDNILSGHYSTGERMPTEPELEKSYGVSRITVRRAIKELETGGLLERKQGRGTFVKYSRVNSSMDSILGFTDSMNSMGQKSRRIIHTKQIVPASTRVAAMLGIERGAPVLELKRTMCDETKPILYDECYYSCARFPGMLEKIGEDVSTYQLIREDYGIAMTRANKRFNVELADEDVSKLLQCSPGAPLFSILKVAYDADDIPVHIAKSLVLASCATYVLDVDQHKQLSMLHLQVHAPDEGQPLMPKPRVFDERD